MNAAAVEVRSSIRTVLASWAGLVTEERRVEPPARDIAVLARFLVRHVDWLCRHPAAGDLADEIRHLERTAARVAYPDDGRRIRVGHCPAPECDGELFALIRPHGDLPRSEITCSESSVHSWPVTRWSKLGSLI
ncbi:hypothetical protein [Saccharomonospora saliphila]|uniref:hypothetical protein n=1 Tax=Saccharomonospora saliphila TaxID=369829 RepID=UPI0009FD320E|nr:hypothetical protein [Saccharomonospora saliphila]